MELGTVKLEAGETKSLPVGSSSSSSGAEIDNSRLKDSFFSKLEDVLENAEIIITALRDLTYSSTDLTMGDTADDVEEFLSQLEKFRARIHHKRDEERSTKEMKQRLIKNEAKLRDLEHSKEKELKESEDKLEVLRKETEVKFADLEKTKREEIEQLQSSLSQNEVNLEILRMENKNLEDKLRTSEEEAKVFKNELDLVKKEKLEGERKLEEFSVDFQLVLDTLRDNGIVLRERKPTPEVSRYFLSMASELPNELPKEWEEMKVLNRSQVGGDGTFKTETSLPLEGDAEDSSEESKDAEEENNISRTTPATVSEAPGENDKQSEAQIGPVNEQASESASKSSEPTPKRSARQKKKRVAFSPDRQEPPRKRMEQDPPPSENLISMTDKKNLERFQCKACGKIYQNRTGLTYHEKSVHLKVRFGCDVCAYQFTSEKGLEDHKKRCSQTGGVKICQQCKKRFKSLEELKSHQKLEHSGE